MQAITNLIRGSGGGGGLVGPGQTSDVGQWGYGSGEGDPYGSDIPGMSNTDFLRNLYGGGGGPVSTLSTAGDVVDPSLVPDVSSIPYDYGLDFAL